MYDTVQGAMAGSGDKRERASTEMPRDMAARYDTVSLEVSNLSSHSQ